MGVRICGGERLPEGRRKGTGGIRIGICREQTCLHRQRPAMLGRDGDIMFGCKDSKPRRQGKVLADTRLFGQHRDDGREDAERLSQIRVTFAAWSTEKTAPIVPVVETSPLTPPMLPS